MANKRQLKISWGACSRSASNDKSPETTSDCSPSSAPPRISVWGAYYFLK